MKAYSQAAQDCLMQPRFFFPGNSLTRSAVTELGGVSHCMLQDPKPSCRSMNAEMVVPRVVLRVPNFHCCCRGRYCQSVQTRFKSFTADDLMDSSFQDQSPSDA